MRVFPDTGGIWVMKSVEPLQLLRGSFARLRLDRRVRLQR